MSVISELRRRQVFRAAAWYGGLAWLAIEVANTVFPQFGLPAWSVRAVIVAAILGLPVVLALAWFFDLRAMGLHREASMPPSAHPEARDVTPAAAAPLWRIPSFWIALVLGAGLAVSAQQAWQRLIRPAFGERPGIAVLPFANLSPDPANAYFADGLHEEILATLARVSGLRVISRTSVVRYRDTKLDLREIARELDVPLILEGSVRREGDDLRLTLQLIDGRSDTHLWAETYDRKFENALHLQRAVAEQIATAIGARLTPAEGQRIDRSAPADPEAYAYYLQALARWSQVADLPELQVIEGLLSRALELDPDFALGYALRAKGRVWIASSTEPPTKAAGPAARLDIERALELQPELPEALAARAYYTTYVELDAAGAVPDLDRALALAPNDADTHGIAGLTARRLGRFDDAISHFREAARLAPAEPAYYGRIFETLWGLGRFDEAESQSRENQRRFPPAFAWYELARFRVHFEATGETAGWRAAYDRLSPGLDAPWRAFHTRSVFLATGDLTGFAAQLETADPSDFESPSERDWELALTYAALGKLAQARPYLELVIETMADSDAPTLRDGAVALALLGRPNEALRAADEAVHLTPESTDAVNGPTMALYRAWVLIRVGGDRAEQGYAELRRVLGAYSVHPRAVAVDQLGVMLRDDARAWQVIQDAIVEQDQHRAAARVTPPAPGADRPP